jgi:hypothetical protein
MKSGGIYDGKDLSEEISKNRFQQQVVGKVKSIDECPNGS